MALVAKERRHTLVTALTAKPSGCLFPGEARALAAFVLAWAQGVDRFGSNGKQYFPCSAGAFDVERGTPEARHWMGRADEVFADLRKHDLAVSGQAFNAAGKKYRLFANFDMVAIVLRREGPTEWVAPDDIRSHVSGRLPPEGTLVFELGSLLRSLLTRATARASAVLAPGDRYSKNKAFPDLSGDGIDDLLHIMLQRDPCEREKFGLLGIAQHRAMSRAHELLGFESREGLCSAVEDVLAGRGSLAARTGRALPWQEGARCLGGGHRRGDGGAAREPQPLAPTLHASSAPSADFEAMAQGVLQRQLRLCSAAGLPSSPRAAKRGRDDDDDDDHDHDHDHDHDKHEIEHEREHDMP
ncbi:hypothetical protein FNF29_02047 [Cafeteria roenbergensis]|uniref:Uncharacterized protein n=1 Tax=Cafeteria roenbergensis TaxID=33653 RepID=A0A5A8CP84_CAFRO|nr:hypothetical protein FNF29_02047 [Cafeteria roenbergensis]|eukprot:KAA0154906.1 hypothetical protein FNF29_02047 [Cafeteria roenbergensis]